MKYKIIVKCPECGHDEFEATDGYYYCTHCDHNIGDDCGLFPLVFEESEHQLRRLKKWQVVTKAKRS